MNTNLNKYGIPILEKKKINEKDRDAEINADS